MKNARLQDFVDIVCLSQNENGHRQMAVFRFADNDLGREPRKGEEPVRDLS